MILKTDLSFQILFPVNKPVLKAMAGSRGGTEKIHGELCAKWLMVKNQKDKRDNLKEFSLVKTEGYLSIILNSDRNWWYTLNSLVVNRKSRSGQEKFLIREEC